MTDDSQKQIEEKDAILHDCLELLIPALGGLKLSQVRVFVDAANDLLSETPFMLLICASRVEVMLRSQMLKMANYMRDRHMGAYQDD